MRTISYTREQQTLIVDWPIDMPWPGSEVFNGFARLMREPRSLQPISRLTLREVWLFAVEGEAQGSARASTGDFEPSVYTWRD